MQCIGRVAGFAVGGPCVKFAQHHKAGIGNPGQHVGSGPQAQMFGQVRHDQPTLATRYQMLGQAIQKTFDETYAAYLKFQDSMERYWSLRYLQQEKTTQIEACFIYRNNVQLDGIPLKLDVSTLTKAQPQGTIIKLAIDNINFVNQTFDFKIIND